MRGVSSNWASRYPNMTKPKPTEPLAPPPKSFPEFALVGLQVPYNFNKVIIVAAAKNGVVYGDQLLIWAVKGAECERQQHEAKLAKSGRI